MESIKDIVAKNCKRLLNRSVNLAEVSRLMQVHPSTISRWKNGEHSPELDKLDRLAEILGVDPLEFFQREEPLRDDNSLELMSQIVSLGPVELEILRNTLNSLSRPVLKDKKSGRNLA